MPSTYFNLVCCLSWILTLFVSYQLSLLLKHFFACRRMNKQNPILYSNCFNVVLSYKSLVFVVALVFVVWMNFMLFLTISISCFAYAWLSTPEYNDVNENYKMSLGYGCALGYYKNYLSRILPNDFLQRIELFQTYHKVKVQKKLFILFPSSCRIQDYLDTSDSIERCRELYEHEESVAGINKRTYNITVYLIKNPNHAEGVRLPIEYAMPLKALYAMKEHNQISREEMLRNYKLFIKYLKEFINEDMNYIGKYCELVEFDDEECNISELLFYRSQNLIENTF